MMKAIIMKFPVLDATSKILLELDDGTVYTILSGHVWSLGPLDLTH